MRVVVPHHLAFIPQYPGHIKVPSLPNGVFFPRIACGAEASNLIHDPITHHFVPSTVSGQELEPERFNLRGRGLRLGMIALPIGFRIERGTRPTGQIHQGMTRRAFSDTETDTVVVV